MTVESHSDGSSSGLSGLPGGWAYIITQDGKIRFSDYGGCDSATNNTMEAQGAIEGLKAILRSGILRPGEGVVLVSDSQYALGLANGTYHPQKNLELAKELRDLYLKVGIGTRWVPGHRYKKTVPWEVQPMDVLLNTRVDQLAGMGKDEHTPEKILKKRLLKSGR